MLERKVGDILLAGDWSVVARDLCEMRLADLAFFRYNKPSSQFRFGLLQVGSSNKSHSHIRPDAGCCGVCRTDKVESRLLVLVTRFSSLVTASCLGASFLFRTCEPVLDDRLAGKLAVTWQADFAMLATSREAH